MKSSKQGKKQQQHRSHEEKDEDEEQGSSLFVKFPRTQHLVNLGAATRDDLIADDKTREEIVGKKGGMVIIEEKIDGANLVKSHNHAFTFYILHFSHNNK
eukprot:TRINITY_DN27423_c0_g1_i1.p1 TRINITY_DN27423_c0_g1~~TRINITY_DN27423_c0_g1_i1.p1  ORF type:complete len:100 (-),score=36.81 TRINITY_DN27423_c0_g1_i1:26-325(-)